MLQRDVMYARRLKSKKFTYQQISEFFEGRHTPNEIEAALEKLQEKRRDRYQTWHSTTVGIVSHDTLKPTAEVLATQQARLMLRPKTITALVCGDPLPGESALDRRC